jgi:hypothetical protein
MFLVCVCHQTLPSRSIGTMDKPEETESEISLHTSTVCGNELKAILIPGDNYWSRGGGVVKDFAAHKAAQWWALFFAPGHLETQLLAGQEEWRMAHCC